MPTILVIWLAKLSSGLSQLLGRGDGSALPGLVAERLRPGLLEYFGHQLDGKVTLITGTNGKTTTTRMIVAALETGNGKILTNRAGSNLTRGLLSTLIADTNWRGQLQAESAVFEVDEASFPEAFRSLKPSSVVILNLFRDQLDRYGELNTLAGKLKAVLGQTKATVVLNGDDPLVAWLGQGLSNVRFFGLDKAAVKKLPHDFAADSNTCPVCGRALVYDEVYYAHIGRYHCSNKDFKRPLINVVGTTTEVSLSTSTSDIKTGSAKADLNLKLPGLYNVYNALAAITVSIEAGRDLSDIVMMIRTMPPAFGRAEVVEIGRRRLQLLLVKNPTGFNQVIQTYLIEGAKQPLLILVNDLIADGRDVSWLWDVAFEDLDGPKQILASGTRAYDLALRLKYADLKFKLAVDIPDALEGFIASIPAGETGLILPTYTAMLGVRRQLADIATVGETRL